MCFITIDWKLTSHDWLVLKEYGTLALSLQVTFGCKNISDSHFMLPFLFLQTCPAYADVLKSLVTVNDSYNK